MQQRWILHVDMDAFFAAVEILDHPHLAGKPVIVGGTPQGRGVVSTASYEARRYGVHSAMPATEAVRRCPHGVFLRPRLSRYSEMSRQVFSIFRQVTPLVEPLSIDEAFLDVTGCYPQRRGDTEPVNSEADAAAATRAARVAEELQSRVAAETRLTCSIGVAENKFLAKVASDLRKPSGLVVVPRGRAAEFLAPLPMRRLWGVGPKTAERLSDAGVETIGDIARRRPEELERLIGVDLGAHIARLARGIDRRKVNTSRSARSISHEMTFAEFIPCDDTAAIDDVLFSLSHQVASRLRHERLWGSTVTLKVRDGSFFTVSRSQTLANPTQLVEEIYPVTHRLFATKVSLRRPSVRLLGVGLSQLTARPEQQLSFFDGDATQSATELARAEEKILTRHGKNAITRGRLLKSRRRPPPAKS